MVRGVGSRPDRERALTAIAIALTFASGAADVTAFTRLGSVFTSVMTGNIVLWGLAIARRSLTLFSHTAVSIGGYITGVAAGTLIGHLAGKAGPGPARVLAGHIRWVLAAELTLVTGFTVGWELCRAAPAGWAQFCLLATLAAAMGMQSVAVNEMGMTQLSTTFLTGTLTALVSYQVKPGQTAPHQSRRAGVLIGLAAGASLGGLLLGNVAAAVPALPLAGLLAALACATRAPA
jgi:uncharacterized membrane protein YoaK (UPF0700 family)